MLLTRKTHPCIDFIKKSFGDSFNSRIDTRLMDSQIVERLPDSLLGTAGNDDFFKGHYLFASSVLIKGNVIHMNSEASSLIDDSGGKVLWKMDEGILP